MRSRQMLTITYHYIVFVLSIFIQFSTLAIAKDATTEQTQINELFSAVTLQRASGCVALKNHLFTPERIKGLTAINPSHGICKNGQWREATLPVDVATLKIASAKNEDTVLPAEISETNNQEKLVQESDIVKTDAKGNLYIASTQYLYIVKGFPADTLSITKKYQLAGYIAGLYLDKINDRLIVISIPVSGNDLKKSEQKFSFEAVKNGYTNVLFFDVSHPENPQLIRQLQFQGNYHTSRRIADRLHLILNDDTLYFDVKLTKLFYELRRIVGQIRCDTGVVDSNKIAKNKTVQRAKKEILTYINEKFDTTTITNYFSTMYQRDNHNTVTQVPLLACVDILYPEKNYVSSKDIVISMDTNGENTSATAIVKENNESYVSKDNIYLTDSSAYYSQYGRYIKNNIPKTVIYKVTISKQRPDYKATGVVIGYFKNQFSLNEYNGDLRITTSHLADLVKINKRGRRKSTFYMTNDLFVLRDNGKNVLKIIGAVRNFGNDETVQSSRFNGDRAFVVTFRNVDPLFSFDLSKPKQPKLLGELTIPGFSSYMHYYDENHIISIGRAGDERGLNGKFQLQMFDISDVKNPRKIHSYELKNSNNYSQSLAEQDHKAFTYFKSKNLLSIPLKIEPNRNYNGFSGHYIFKVSIQNGFKKIGSVNHSFKSFRLDCDSNLLKKTIYGCEYDHIDDYDLLPRRTVIMANKKNTYLYTISDVGLKVGNLNNFDKTIGTILFPPVSNYEMYNLRLRGLRPITND